MQGRQNWYFVVRADIVAIPSLRVLQYIDHISGYEPRRLFNIVEFMMNDRDGSGSVSVEEAMQILYLRFGKGLLDTKYLAPLIQIAQKIFPSRSSYKVLPHLMLNSCDQS